MVQWRKLKMTNSSVERQEDEREKKERIDAQLTIVKGCLHPNVHFGRGTITSQGFVGNHWRQNGRERRVIMLGRAHGDGGR